MRAVLCALASYTGITRSDRFPLLVERLLKTEQRYNVRRVGRQLILLITKKRETMEWQKLLSNPREGGLL